MQTITIPLTDLRVSRLGFGTASLHHLKSSASRQALLHAAWDCGITHFDSARMYGHGLSEREIGLFAQRKRHSVTIATKFGIPASPWLEAFAPLMYLQKAASKVLPIHGNTSKRLFSKQDADRSLSLSLRALATDFIDILFVHDPFQSDTHSIQMLADWLSETKRSGKARYLGLAGSVSSCLSILENTGDLFDILQVEDSNIGCQADELAAHGRSMQITYGYLRQEQSASMDVESVMRQAMKRNSTGQVLVSTRRCERVREFAEIVGRC